MTTDCLLDGQSCIRTTDSNSNQITYLTGPRGPEYERSGTNAPKWNLYDGLGSVVGTVDASGNILSKRKFDVYGANRGLIGESGTKHKFVGGLGHPSEDETGLVYMRARWMDPVTGRFVSEDPARSGTNWYQYGNANPVRAVDSTGREATEYRPGDMYLFIAAWYLGAAAYFAWASFHFGSDLIASTIKLIGVGGGPVGSAIREIYMADYVRKAIDTISAVSGFVVATYMGRQFLLLGMMLNDEYEQSDGVPNWI